MRAPLIAVLTATAVIAVALTGCAAADDGIRLPPASGAPDYQLGGAYAPPPGVTIIARDRTADPEPGADVYDICYVNGFQTQPGELGDWPVELLLTDAAGDSVVDPDWPDEVLLDTSTAEARDAIVDRVGVWIEGCADAGFDAVEFDNLDSHTRSGGALTAADNLALATALVARAHEAGLAAGQKNSAEDAAALRDEAGFDFAITEECAAYEECEAYTEVYGRHVIAIEYTDNLPRPFDEVCADPSTPESTVLRDRDLTTPDDPAYVFALCDGGWDGPEASG